MDVIIIQEAGYHEALQGLGLSFKTPGEGFTEERLTRLKESVAPRLAPMGMGHNKFLESMQVWLSIKAPRYWWAEFDTYRVGTTKQSESTMHTMTRRELVQEDFEEPVWPPLLDWLNRQIRKKTDFRILKNNLPEGFLQERIVSTNYMVLRNMILQRQNHKLPQWHLFIRALAAGLKYPELLPIPEDHKNTTLLPKEEVTNA